MPSYVIAKTSKRSEFFTASSSYDRPLWVKLTEATVYVTADAAELACRKLFRFGSSLTSVVANLEELAGLQLAPIAATVIRKREDILPAETDMLQADGQPVDDPENCDDIQGCPVPGDDPITGLPGVTVPSADDYAPTPDDGLPSDIDSTIADIAALLTASPVIEGEIPKGRGSNPKSEDTIEKFPDIGQIKFNDPVYDSMPPLENVDGNQDPDEEKAAIPPKIKSQLATAIKEYAAKVNSKSYDQDTTSFYMTVQGAMEELAEYLAQGTVDGLKRAQVKLTSFMSPITVLIPEEVRAYLYRLGQPCSLKDLVGDIKQKTVTNESVEGDFATWKKACSAKGSNVQFAGGMDGCQAVHWDSKSNPVVGDWDGQNGIVHDVKPDHVANEGAGHNMITKAKSVIGKALARSHSAAKNAALPDAVRKQYGEHSKQLLKDKKAIKTVTKADNVASLDIGKKYGKLHEFANTPSVSYSSPEEALKDFHGILAAYRIAQKDGTDPETVNFMKSEALRIRQICREMGCAV